MEYMRSAQRHRKNGCTWICITCEPPGGPLASLSSKEEQKREGKSCGIGNLNLPLAPASASTINHRPAP
ncbi:hypothetical protein J3E68DRAFT_177042 [Trichoderma sp. SZMC 28012]